MGGGNMSGTLWPPNPGGCLPRPWECGVRGRADMHTSGAGGTTHWEAPSGGGVITYWLQPPAHLAAAPSLCSPTLVFRWDGDLDLHDGLQDLRAGQLVRLPEALRSIQQAAAAQRLDLYHIKWLGI